ncbi:MAG: aldolase [Chloroflexi bacterium]|nr:aldolase [Chloroflexota bacterium]
MNGHHAWEDIVKLGASLFGRRLTFGRTGNISIRDGDRILITPTNTGLGSLAGTRPASIGIDGTHHDGPPPSKEAFLHAAMYRARPEALAVVHLHSTNAVAVSCLTGLDVADALPPLTAYYAMRVGRLPLLPYYRPGDPALRPVAEQAALRHHALLLANHGPIAAAADLSSAADVVEEIEETARIFLRLHGLQWNALTPAQIADIRSWRNPVSEPADA